MKILGFIGLVMIPFLTIQCSSNDDDTSYSAEEIMVGDWKVDGIWVQGNITATGVDQELWGWIFNFPNPVVLRPESVEIKDFYMSFPKLPYKVLSNVNFALNYSVDLKDWDNKVYDLTKEIGNTDFLKEGFWKLDGNRVIIGDEDLEENYVISELSYDVLKIYRVFTDDIF